MALLHADGIARLTPREKECLRLGAPNCPSKEIGRRLGISQYTVDGYLDEARRKLGAADRFEAGRLYRAHEAQLAGSLSGEEGPGGPAAGVEAPDAGLQTKPVIDRRKQLSTDDLRVVAGGAGLQSGSPPRGSHQEPAGAPERPTIARTLAGHGAAGLTPLQRLMVILIIAAGSLLVVSGLLWGARELTLSLQPPTPEQSSERR